MFPPVVGLEHVEAGGSIDISVVIGARRAQWDPRLRLTRIFDAHKRFGGRTQEMAQLDSFAAAPAPRYLLVTGDAGMGKTALLTAWIRRLEARGLARVVYHLLDRRRGTAGQLDALTSLVAQAYPAWSGAEPPDLSGATVGELEVEWLTLLAGPPVPREVVVVVDGLDEAQGWRVTDTLFPPGLPDRVHVVLSARSMVGRHWPTELGLNEPVELQLRGLEVADVEAVARAGGVPEWALAADPLATVAARARGNPYYVALLVDDLRSGKIHSAAELERRPTGLDAYLHRWWESFSGPVGALDAVNDLVGYLLVAVAPITREELVDVDGTGALRGSTFDAALLEIERFVVEESDRHGLSLVNQPLRDYVGTRFSDHEQHVLRDRLLAWCDRWASHLFRYAVVHGVTHRIQAATEPADLFAAATLLRSDKYQLERVTKAGDAGGLFHDVDDVLAAMSRRTDLTVDELVTEAMTTGEVRRRWLQPESVFELAWHGKLGEAKQRLALLPGGQSWRRAALLIVAWIGSTTAPAKARKLIAEVDTSAFGREPLGLLHERVVAALGAGPEPDLAAWRPLRPLPSTSLRSAAQAALLRLGGAPDAEDFARGLRPIADFTEENELGSYLAESDAPPLVAFARDVPEVGDAWLANYIDQHSSNPYARYRDESLWAVLGAVSQLPDAIQARRHAAHLTTGALGPPPVRFAEFAALAARAHSARRGESGAHEWASALTPRWTEADQWGHHSRRLAAHAEIAVTLLDDLALARELLSRADGIPAGYAGYEAPAALGRAEAYLVAAPTDREPRQRTLQAAWRAAHNVQDPAFCALTTARVNAITRWWSTPVTHVAALVSEFLADPAAARFGPVHRRHEHFALRSHSDHLPVDYVTAAQSLPDLADRVFHVPVVSLARLNPVPDADLVAIPDADFPPIMAGWLSAQLVATALPVRVKAQLLARLVPVAAADDTMLDLVLGRLLVTLDQPDPALVQRVIHALAGRETTEPAGGTEAGIA